MHQIIQDCHHNPASHNLLIYASYRDANSNGINNKPKSTFDYIWGTFFQFVAWFAKEARGRFHISTLNKKSMK